MLHLVESAGRPRSRRSGWMVGSTLVHGALIAAMAAIGTKEVARRVPQVVDRVIYTAPPPASQQATAAPATRTVPHGDAVPRPLLDLARIPLPGIGAIGDVTPRTASPSDWGDPIGIEPSSPTLPVGTGGVFDARAVDRAVLPMATNRSPEYPSMLRSAGIRGEVLVRFVVDTTGRVEPSSVEIHQASHDLFADAVHRWLPRTRYVPAEVAGRPVRQLVEQRVEFTLTR